MKTYRFTPAGSPKQATESVREWGWVSPSGRTFTSACGYPATRETHLYFQNESTVRLVKIYDLEAGTRESFTVDCGSELEAWCLAADRLGCEPLAAQYLYDIEEVVRCERCGAECDESGGDVHYCGARSFMDAVAADSANAMSEALDQEVFGDTQPVINFYPFTGESPADRLEPVYRGIRRALAKQREKSQESAVAKLPDYQRGPIIRCQGDEDGDV